MTEAVIRVFEVVLLDPLRVAPTGTSGVREAELGLFPHFFGGLLQYSVCVESSGRSLWTAEGL